MMVAKFLKRIFWPAAFGIFLLAALISTFCAPARADDLRAHATQMEIAYELPRGLLAAIITQESHWRNVAGQHGEIGLAQIKPDTVRMICPACSGNVHQKLFTFGSRGDEVARIQAALAREGLYTGAIDGIFGSLTHKAVLLFQQRSKLYADAVVGPRTWRAMFGQHDPFPGVSIAQALWEPKQNIEWAARYLAWLRDNVSDDPDIMAAAYNGGPANPVVRYMVRVRERAGKPIPAV